MPRLWVREQETKGNNAVWDICDHVGEIPPVVYCDLRAAKDGDGYVIMVESSDWMTLEDAYKLHDDIGDAINAVEAKILQRSKESE